MHVYRETFDDNSGGWWGWISNAAGPKALEYRPGVVTSRSPWWIDYNHAPPGAGYLHLLFCTYTRGPLGEHIQEVGGPNGLINGNFSTDYRNAQVTVHARGELNTQGAELVLLVQATVGGVTSAWVLTGQPLTVTSDWREQTITLVNDDRQWTALGSRHDRRDCYGRVDLDAVLRDVNVDIIFVLFPLTIVPMGDIAGDPHILRPDKDYPVWRSQLPEGYVELDTIEIAFADLGVV